MEYFIVCAVCSVVIFWLVVLLLIYRIYICAHQGMALESKKKKKETLFVICITVINMCVELLEVPIRTVS